MRLGWSVIVFVTGAVACSSSEPPARVEGERVAIPALQCALEVPAGTEVTLTGDGATFTTRPGTRVSRSFGVHARSSEEAGELRQGLADDVSIAYSVHKSRSPPLRVIDRPTVMSCSIRQG